MIRGRPGAPKILARAMSPRSPLGLQIDRYDTERPIRERSEPMARSTDNTPDGYVVDFKSRAHRDEVMAKVMCGERVAQLLDAEQLADMNRMSYGGFETFVSA
jgi:hypothetical protein